VALPITDEVGFGLAAVLLAYHYWRGRRHSKKAKVA
jgi:hypothetical protein